MQCQFNQQVSIEGKVFRCGVNDVPESLLEHPHFVSYVKCGWICEVDAPAQKPETMFERSQRLHEKLMAKHSEKPKSKRQKKEKDEPQGE
jgi:hypothetical protein